MLGKIFRVFDVNSDGTITKKEMQRLVADLFGLIQIQHKDQNQANLKMYLLLKDHGFNTSRESSTLLNAICTTVCKL